MNLAFPRIAILLLAVLALASPQAEAGILHDEVYPLAPIPDVATWTQVGNGHALEMTDGSLLLNDNASWDRIAFQGFLGEIEAAQRVVVEARMFVISNVGGLGATLEIARPGAEAVLRLFPDHIELHERRADGRSRWLGSAQVSLAEFVQLHFRKESLADGEVFVVEVDGIEYLRGELKGEGALGVGRVMLGSQGYGDYGASVWDWVHVKIEETSRSATPVQNVSFGGLKGSFRP